MLQILDTALKQVKRDKAAFAMLVKEGERLAETGNVLADAANRERLDADAQALEVLTRIATRAGPISDALSDAARAFKAGKVGRGEAARGFIDAVRGADLAQLANRPGAGGGVAGDAGPADRPAGPAAGDQLSGGTPEGEVAPDPRQETFFQPAAERPRIGEGAARYVERPDGRYVALADGSDVLGTITPEIATALGREAATIRLPEGDARFGEAHIEARHGTDIRKAGYADAADLVAEVVSSYTAVRRGDRGRLILVRENGRDRAAIVELRPTEDGAHWSVTTAGLFRPEYLGNKELLWHQPGPAGTSPEGESPFNPGSQSSDKRLRQDGGPGNAPDGSPRASVELGDGFARITLGATRDQTSFTHEFGHVGLDLLRRLGTDAATPESLRRDWETVRDWLGATDGEALSRGQHEQWAQGFERYLAEGEAPSLELRSVFERFKAWMLGIYRALNAIAPDIPADVRAVFEAMSATDQQRARLREASAGDVGRDPFPPATRAAAFDPAAERIEGLARTMGFDTASELDANINMLAAEGRLSAGDTAALAEADALAGRAEVYARAYKAAARGCVPRIPETPEQLMKVQAASIVQGGGAGSTAIFCSATNKPIARSPKTSQ